MTLTAIPSYPVAGSRSFDLFPQPSELTVAQAAEFLDGSEGYVDELLNAGLIVFRLKNGKRLVQWDSLLDFAQEEDRKNATLNEMVRMDQEMGLYDD